MPMDDRKQRILMEIVALYGAAGEPVGSGLLSRQFDMAVSSATLRNEMAALTKLGLLEQPHTSAGRVPTAKGYRYYVDNLLRTGAHLAPRDCAALEQLFAELDYDPEKMAQGAAKALSDHMRLAVVATTPRAEDICIAHFEVIQVGRFSAAVLAVTAAGGVRTRVAKVDFELGEGDIERVRQTLNTFLRFVVAADVTPLLLRDMLYSLDGHGERYTPLLNAALTLLSEFGRPSVYLEGLPYLLRWPELEGSLGSIVELTSDQQALESLIRPPRGGGTTVLFGEELQPAIRGLCVVSRRYLAGGGLTGVIGVVGPSRMRFSDVIPRLEYFSELLGKGFGS